MASIIRLKRSSVAAKVPTTAQLDLGELAVNTRDGKLFLKRADGSEEIVEVGARWGAFTAHAVGNTLTFRYNGTDILALDASGNLTVLGDAHNVICSVHGKAAEEEAAPATEAAAAPEPAVVGQKGKKEEKK